MNAKRLLVRLSQYSKALPITGRGVLFLTLAAYLFWIPARQDQDIIASVFAPIIISILFLLLALVVILGIRTQRTLAIELFANPGSSGQLYSQKSYPLYIKVHCPRILPLLQIDLKIEFAGGLSLGEFRLVGRGQPFYEIDAQVSFPHRGIWRVLAVSGYVHDCFGLTSFRFRKLYHESPTYCEVHPPEVSSTQLPIITSTVRSGDALPFSRQRGGDYYDFKQYHPSDGARRIVWKMFARSGELVARHPEEAVIPEGHVIVFCLARSRDDALTRSTLNYLRQLEEANVNVLFSCLGADYNHLAENYTDAQNLLVSSAWPAGQSFRGFASLRPVELFLTACNTRLPELQVSNYILILPLSDVTEAEQIELLDYLQRLQRKPELLPVLCGVSTHKIGVQTSKEMNALWSKLIFQSNSQLARPLPDNSDKFRRICHERHWTFHEATVSL